MGHKSVTITLDRYGTCSQGTRRRHRRCWTRTSSGTLRG